MVLYASVYYIYIVCMHRSGCCSECYIKDQNWWFIWVVIFGCSPKSLRPEYKSFRDTLRCELSKRQISWKRFIMRSALFLSPRPEWLWTRWRGLTACLSWSKCPKSELRLCTGDYIRFCTLDDTYFKFKVIFKFKLFWNVNPSHFHQWWKSYVLCRCCWP